MPRLSQFQIDLSSDEEQELAARSRKYTLPYFQVQRARMILLAAEGVDNDEIARRLQTRREIVSLWRKRFFEKRLAGLDERPRPGRPRLPPDLLVQIKALACELPSAFGMPLSRWSTRDLAAVCRSGVGASISGTTIWRWLNEDAIRPWQHRCWILPRDPRFAEKAGRILDLYERTWEGHGLKDDEFVLSTDERTSIQARHRTLRSLPPQPGSAMKIEHEYKRCGAWAYLAALDVHRAKLFGRCEKRSGIGPFDRLVDQVMRQAPYNEARRVFWIMDNGYAHRAPTCITRLRNKHKRLVPVHGPVHASWLNQIEIYFSIVQRKALTPNDFDSLHSLRKRLPVRFPTKIPALLRLPVIENNWAEGMVLKPEERAAGDGRPIIKRKIDEFDEKRFDESQSWDPHQKIALDGLVEWAAKMTNPSRVASARSKVGEHSEAEIVDEVTLDVLIDLGEAFPDSMSYLTDEEEQVLRREIARMTWRLNPTR